MSDIKKTPLYDVHEAAGGKIVEFAGYYLPVQYSGVIAEHNAVRTAAGLFDVSHMGEFTLKGPDALANLNNLLTNDFTSLACGGARYSPMCNERGGVVDDLIVYRIGDGDYFIVVNASNKDKDYEWMKSRITGDAVLTDVSDDYAQIALQGPRAVEIIKKLTCEGNIPAKGYTFTPDAVVSGVKCLLSRTGYTGEDGFELYCAPADAAALWRALVEAGREYGLVPCGLGARDTLRLEAAMPLYGHEMADDITPYEAGLGRWVKPEKPFIGRDALVAAGEPKRVRVGLKVTGKGIVREHEKLRSGVREIGFSTSGTFCPTLGGAYAMAIVDKEYSEIGTAFEADVRGRAVAVEVCPLPFYKRSK